jgi:hypothetical protein
VRNGVACNHVGQNGIDHKPASLYVTFAAEEARRLVKRFIWHYTPKHGSWLNVTESEIAVFTRQCLDHRIADRKTLAEETAAWQKRRNKHPPKPIGNSQPPLRARIILQAADKYWCARERAGTRCVGVRSKSARQPG